MDNNTFDFILFREVIEHLEDPKLAIKELTRVLEKNAEILLTASFLSLYQQSPYFYFSGFSKYWFK